MRVRFVFAGVLTLCSVMVLSAAGQTAPSTSARHVWTNDDLAALRDKAGISILGEPPAQAAGKHEDSKVTAGAERQREEKAQRFRRQLQPLYAELPRIDAEIAEMRRFQDGSYRMTGFWPLRFSGMPLNPADRSAQLEAREREVRSRISDLEDEARHAGILPGELR